MTYSSRSLSRVCSPDNHTLWAAWTGLGGAVVAQDCGDSGDQQSSILPLVL